MKKINIHKIMESLFMCSLLVIALVGGFMFGVGTNPPMEKDFYNYSDSADYQIGSNNTTTTFFNGSNVIIPIFMNSRQFPGLYLLSNLHSVKNSSTSWTISWSDSLRVFNENETYAYWTGQQRSFTADLTTNYLSSVTYKQSPSSTNSTYYIYYQFIYTKGRESGLGDIVGCSYGTFTFGEGLPFDDVGYNIAIDSFTWGSSASSTAKMFYLSYFDSNFSSWSIVVRASSSAVSTNNFAIYPRTYYFTQTDNNAYYNEGYNLGYNVGYGDGSSQGFNDAYDHGYNVGFDNGYIEGEHAGNNYTFMSLMGAVVDAPVRAFRGLFSFDLFGVQMSSFLSAFLTFALAMFLLRYILK